MRLQLESNWGFFEEWADECKADLIDMVGRVFDDVCEPLKGQRPQQALSARNAAKE